MIEFLVRRHLDHQANSSTIEERETWRHLEEELHSERVPVESHGAIQIFHRRGNLTDSC